jgi:hypothetical protein
MGMDHLPHPDDDLAARIEVIKRLGLPADETEFLIATLKQFVQEVNEHKVP